MAGARVDAQRLVDRGEQVALADRVVLDILAVGVGGPVDLSALDAAAGQHHRPAADVVVAAGAVVDVRRPADLAHPHHERVLAAARAPPGPAASADQAGSSTCMFALWQTKLSAWLS